MFDKFPFLWGQYKIDIAQKFCGHTTHIHKTHIVTQSCILKVIINILTSACISLCPYIQAKSHT